MLNKLTILYHYYSYTNFIYTTNSYPVADAPNLDAGI